VRLGDGWHPSNIDPTTLAQKLPTLHRFCQEAGRDPASLTLSTRVNNIGFREPNRNVDGRIAPLSGTPQQMLDKIRRYEDAGVSHIVIGLRRQSAAEMRDTMQRFAHEVRSKA